MGEQVGNHLRASLGPPHPTTNWPVPPLPLSGGTGRGTPIPGGFDPPKQSRNGGLSSPHTSSPLGLFALLPLSGGTGHRTPIGGLFGASANHQFGLFALLPLSGETGRGTPIPGGFDPPKKTIRTPFGAHDHRQWACHPPCFFWACRAGQKHSLLTTGSPLPWRGGQKGQILDRVFYKGVFMS